MPPRPSIAARCRLHFTTKARALGEDDVRAGRVAAQPPGTTGVVADVHADGKRPSRCGLDWREAERGRIGFHCDCRAFTRDGDCEHLWALLLHLDATGVGADVPGVGHLQRYTLGDEEMDALSAAADRALDGTRDADPTPDTDVDEADADADAALDADADADAGADADADAGDDAACAAEPPIPTPAPPPAAPAQAPASRAALLRAAAARVAGARAPAGRVEAGARAPAGRAEAGARATAGKVEPAVLWLVVNLQASERQDLCVVECFASGLSPAGERVPGRPADLLRPVGLDDRHADLLDVDDRALMARLLRPDPEALELRRPRRPDQHGHAALPTDLAFEVLPRIARAGRLLVRDNARKPPDTSRRLVVDDGAPVQLHLHLLERPRSWLLTATVVGGDAAREGAAASAGPAAAGRAWPLGVAKLVLSDGLVLREGTLHRIDMLPGAQQWLEVLRRQTHIDVPQRDRAALLEFVAGYSGRVPLHLPAALRLTESVGRPQPVLLLKSLDSYDRRHVEARLSYEYDGRRVVDAEKPAAWIDEGARSITRRDFAAETQCRETLQALEIGFVHGSESAPGQLPMELRLPFPRLVHILRELAGQHWRIELANKRLHLEAAGEWQVSSGVDWFELRGELSFNAANPGGATAAVPVPVPVQGVGAGATATLPALLQAVRRGQAVVTLADGSSGLIPEAWLSRLESIARLGEAEGDAVRFKPSQALLLDALLAERAGERVAARSDAAYRRRLAELLEDPGSRSLDPPDTFQGELRAYQREGLGWFEFLRRARIGGCLADDMGLGKTVQVLALLDSRRRQKAARPSIVVVPKSLVFNWREEAARFTPELRVLAYVGPMRRDLKGQLARTDVVLTTYATLLRDIGFMKDIPFDYAILDEAQAIKNEGSQSAKACRLLDAEHRLAMSGTPIENHLGELWSLFEFLNPGMLGSVASFRSLAHVDDADDLHALQRALRPFILRRTKSQVLSELPEKSEQTLVCELSDAERVRYDELLNHYRATLLREVRQVGIGRSRMHVLEALLRLRQAALHPGLLDPSLRGAESAKFEALIEQLEELLPEGHKALIFSQFTGLLGLLREALDARGWSYAYLDGKTRDRQAVVNRFQEDPTQQLFLISLRAGGHGLNLTAADYVFILDPWWNPAVEAQAIDRAHRIGQSRAVFAYRLIAADTIEQRIVDLQARKRELADAIITAENAAPSALTAEDLELLLS
jgi:superfamily II DNA or RNA helicase